MNQSTEKAEAVEKPIAEARARGVHIGLVLLDRAFSTVDVIAALKRLGVYLIMPAVKNEKVKMAMMNYNGQHPAERFILGDGKRTSASTFTYTGAQLRNCRRKRSCMFTTSILVSQQTFHVFSIG